ncbi:response regulator transcription factor [Natronolimnobius baerhuensis]|uniref:Response regulator n=1 Tax=Natronolimnobius baerhuensis TaxID=253108 RepID=A0A202EAT6_9EURY|nr:response regulator [Natronolimnobius baerhuensis]OVE85362.1 response regulator [Natronolimnobius baerhuensis]
MTHQILIAEDDEPIIEILRYRLESDTFDVEAVTDGDDCWETLEAAEELPDALLLDVMMPGLDGFTVLKRIRDDSRYDDLVVILVTGRGLEEDVVRGFELGADDYVMKPFSPSEIAVRLKRSLR